MPKAHTIRTVLDAFLGRHTLPKQTRGSPLANMSGFKAELSPNGLHMLSWRGELFALRYDKYIVISEVASALRPQQKLRDYLRDPANAHFQFTRNYEGIDPGWVASQVAAFWRSLLEEPMAL